MDGEVGAGKDQKQINPIKFLGVVSSIIPQLSLLQHRRLLRCHGDPTTVQGPRAREQLQLLFVEDGDEAAGDDIVESLQEGRQLLPVNKIPKLGWVLACSFVQTMDKRWLNP